MLSEGSAPRQFLGDPVGNASVPTSAVVGVGRQTVAGPIANGEVDPAPQLRADHGPNCGRYLRLDQHERAQSQSRNQRSYRLQPKPETFILREALLGVINHAAVKAMNREHLKRSEDGAALKERGESEGVGKIKVGEPVKLLDVEQHNLGPRPVLQETKPSLHLAEVIARKSPILYLRTTAPKGP